MTADAGVGINFSTAHRVIFFPRRRKVFQSTATEPDRDHPDHNAEYDSDNTHMTSSVCEESNASDVPSLCPNDARRNHAIYQRVSQKHRRESSLRQDE
jgi:hypothetical protein